MRQAENKKALDLLPVSHSHIKTSSDIQLLGLFFTVKCVSGKFMWTQRWELCHFNELNKTTGDAKSLYLLILIQMINPSPVSLISVYQCNWEVLFQIWEYESSKPTHS